MNLILVPITALGSFANGILEFVGGLGYLMLDTAIAARAGFFGKRSARFAWKNLWIQMDRLGVASVPIVSLVMACIGAILALQIAPILKGFGQQKLVANVNSIAIFRELGPLISAVVLTGFAGASIAAEIGSMVVAEEIDALQAQAIDPIRFLVVPRVIATTIMMICLAVVGDLAGVLGGLATGRAFLGMNTANFIDRTFAAAKMRDFLTGLVKAGVFGTLISSLACFLGLNVTGGAQGVGLATTRTVVLTIVALILVDLLFTGVFYYLGL
jgi:phospholipid/cholesterol/gamma-HCH transport system permease protein